MGNIYVMRDKEHFPDGGKFIPERWLKANQPDACPHKKATNPFVYLPFGFGPRTCICRRIAMMELSVILKRFLDKYHIEHHYSSLKYENGFVLTPVGDMRFKLIEI